MKLGNDPVSVSGFTPGGSAMNAVSMLKRAMRKVREAGKRVYDQPDASALPGKRYTALRVQNGHNKWRWFDLRWAKAATAFRQSERPSIGEDARTLSHSFQFVPVPEGFYQLIKNAGRNGYEL